MKFLSTRAGATHSSSIFNCFGKGETDQKDTEQILQHYKSRSVFSLHYFRKTFSTPFCIELTIASTYSTLLIKSKSSMSWLTEPFDCFSRVSQLLSEFRFFSSEFLCLFSKRLSCVVCSHNYIFSRLTKLALLYKTHRSCSIT